MKAYVIYCPHLGRDVRNILAHVPNVEVYTGYKTLLGCDGCLEAHKSIVRAAKFNELPMVMVCVPWPATA